MIDLHSHSTASDGELTPAELLCLAEERGLKAFSITDHDTVKAYDNLEIKRYYSGEFINGVELRCKFGAGIIEILGYGFELEKMQKQRVILEAWSETPQDWYNDFEYLKAKAKKLGIIYTSDLQKPEKNIPAHDYFVDDIMQYRQNKAILDELSIHDRTSFFRGHILNPKSPFVLQRHLTAPAFEEVIAAIKDCGGLCILAHPGKYFFFDYRLLVEEICKSGMIDGLECMHSSHSREQIAFFKNFCDEQGLLKSGGSDFHNSKRTLGIGSREKDEIYDGLIADLRVALKR